MWKKRREKSDFYAYKIERTGTHGGHREAHRKVQRRSWGHIRRNIIRGHKGLGEGGYRGFDTVWVMVDQGFFDGVVDSVSIYCIKSE